MTENNQQDEMMVTLTDDNGDQQNFIVLDAMEIEELGQYVMLAPAEADESEETEVLILKVVQGENEDEDMFVSIDNEEENEVFEQFQARWQEEEDAEFGSY